MGKIIATDGGGKRFVVETSEDKGYVIDLGQGLKTEEMNLMTIGKAGYWEGYEGRMTPEDLDRKLEIWKKRR
jgi:hypothetical protein